MPVSRNPNRVLCVVIGFVIIAVVVVSFLSTRQSAVVMDRTTPAGSVQVFLKAVLEGKNAEATRMLSPESTCTVTDLDRAYIVNTARVLLLGSTTTGATAEVRVRVEIPSGGPIKDVMTDEDHTFVLANAGGGWLITGIPWPLYDCGVLNK
jgi:hypothetical protein